MEMREDVAKQIYFFFVESKTVKIKWKYVHGHLSMNSVT